MSSGHREGGPSTDSTEMLYVCYISGGGTWGTTLYTLRGVVSRGRDVDAWRANGLYAEDRGLCLFPMTLEHFFSDRHASTYPIGPH
jgi:hypothetical protein